MSAVRMVAYGVLENVNDFSLKDREDEATRIKIKERDTIRKMVREELKEFDLLIQPLAVQEKRSGRFRAIKDRFMLYGPLSERKNDSAWVTRGVLGEGTFRECCLMAVKFMEPFNHNISPHTYSDEGNS